MSAFKLGNEYYCCACNPDESMTSDERADLCGAHDVTKTDIDEVPRNKRHCENCGVVLR